MGTNAAPVQRFAFRSWTCGTWWRQSGRSSQCVSIGRWWYLWSRQLPRWRQQRTAYSQKTHIIVSPRQPTSFSNQMSDSSDEDDVIAFAVAYTVAVLWRQI